jgi:hypothetical protein
MLDQLVNHNSLVVRLRVGSLLQGLLEMQLKLEKINSRKSKMLTQRIKQVHSLNLMNMWQIIMMKNQNLKQYQKCVVRQ